MVVTEAPVGAWSKGGCLRVLLEINEQSVYLLSYQRTIRYISVALCAIGTSPDIAIFSVHSVTLCALSCKGFSLSFYISEELKASS